MTQRILVTGGAGYLGSTMVPDLLAAGHKVTVLDNFMYDQASLNHVCNNPNFKVVKGDIRVRETIAPLIAEADVIIPLAAYVGAPLCSADPVGAKTINHDAILMMLDLASKDQLILMPTTNSAYGSGEEGNFCTEDSPLRPISQYAIEKVAVEKVLMQHPNAVSFRLATVFGMSPRMRIDLLVNDFTYRAVKDRTVVLFESHFKRNYIHVRDVSRVFQHALANRDAMVGQIYNVGLSDANVSKLELCEHIKAEVPNFIYVEAQLGTDPDRRNYIVSNEKVEATGYKPQMSLSAGIRELLKGFTMLRNTRYGNV
ncbi:NAD(P)-dependent oxidoreductase [Breoghania sp. L-A4]|uniref:NAD-dependent epimerase/dehydratase family protein n=1 Tax=Breoghania sp. L-A4 TaxID=2304600 RepID=UPI000E35E072|nr:NAD(P)-dependent oxidoreductase [Breoghania sp. L-A4]AXS40640.1 NAD(P)-dependent oxidoreductase [Breoghania sp. L-A4]